MEEKPIENPKSTEQPVDKETLIEPPVHQISIQDALEKGDLKTLMAKNLLWSQILYKQQKRIQRRLTLMVVGDYFRLALFVLPLIFAALYLPPLLKGVFGTYGSLLQGGDGTKKGTSASFTIPPQALELFSTLSEDQQKAVQQFLSK